MPSLRYIHDTKPGITRRKIGNRWAYYDPDGARIAEQEEIDRLNGIGLPPAYEQTWFSPDPRTHILATGIDARGRKQYRYHPDFRAARDARKFGSCAAFAALLPKIRARVEKDLARRKLDEPRAIASVVRLLDTGRIRIGNEAYARANKSFGATTLRRRHAKIDHGRLTLRFRAKSGKLCQICVSDRGLVRFVKQMQDLQGQHLFQYLDEAGELCHIGSSDVNDYIHEAMGEAYTAKHFRTWRASALAFEWLATSKETGLKPMLAYVAEQLCNTPAIARKSYIHPALIEAARSPEAFRKALRLPRKSKWMSRYERGLLDWLGNVPPCSAG